MKRGRNRPITHERATPHHQERDLTPSEVAAMLNMSTSWVYREASKLGLKGYKLGRGRNAKVLYKRTEIFKWLEQQKVH
ncbi:helix-turn-helix domain-containing protein [Streptomyces sp. NBC_00893]|uniref:helix-turn-helix domain-containing protein n=1 Tax=Streptomyces sp. NBC_00893 TaxID=2975862 RepID=UPI00225B72FA|nr:helix-turn-helix domain-containing protein [Streptomyces sp. NBC_00893]MCX4850722.1 helix-turn-helix domain-containing protein [Streptomyces sp. NBC_00893]